MCQVGTTGALSGVMWLKLHRYKDTVRCCCVGLLRQKGTVRSELQGKRGTLLGVIGPELQRYKDTIRCGVQAAKVPEHRQKIADQFLDWALKTQYLPFLD